MIALHTRARCDECGNAPAVAQIDDVFFLCASCEAIILDTFASASPSPDVKAVAGGISPPVPALATATFSVSDGAVSRSLPSGESEPSVTLACAPSGFNPNSVFSLSLPGAPKTAADASALPLLYSVDLDLDAIWTRDGIPNFPLRNAANETPFDSRSAP